jgi:hypothetical protein
MRKAKDFILARLITVALVAGVLVLSGCGAGEKPAATHARVKAKAHKSLGNSQPGAEDLSEMVAAVSGSKAGPPVEMKFVLTSKPEVGQAMDIDVAVIPRAPVPDSLSVTFQAAEGIDVVDGSHLEKVEKLVDGTPVRHVIKILPKRDGIFAVTAVVSFTSANQDLVRTFSIPLVAGEGLSEQVAKGP